MIYPSSATAHRAFARRKGRRQHCRYSNGARLKDYMQFSFAFAQWTRFYFHFKIYQSVERAERLELSINCLEGNGLSR